jgi:hypothetical protein
MASFREGSLNNKIFSLHHLDTPDANEPGYDVFHYSDMKLTECEITNACPAKTRLDCWTF